MNTTKYTTTTEDGKIKLLQASYIDSENIKLFKFTFSSGKDITDSINDTNKKAGKPELPGRLGHSNMACTYPDGNTTQKVVLMDCILQYRSLLIDKRAETNKYCKEFICCGIPEIYIDTFTKNARTNTGLKLEVKNDTPKMEGYYWLNINLKGLNDSNVWFYFTDNSNQVVGCNPTITETFIDNQKHIRVNITVTVTGNLFSDSPGKPLDLVNGNWTISVKPTEVFMRGFNAELRGPELENQSGSKETTQISPKLIIDDEELKAYAMKIVARYEEDDDEDKNE